MRDCGGPHLWLLLSNHFLVHFAVTPLHCICVFSIAFCPRAPQNFYSDLFADWRTSRPTLNAPKRHPAHHAFKDFHASPPLKQFENEVHDDFVRWRKLASEPSLRRAFVFVADGTEMECCLVRIAMPCECCPFWWRDNFVIPCRQTSLDFCRLESAPFIS